jgi:hypothetical protein
MRRIEFSLTPLLSVSVKWQPECKEGGHGHKWRVESSRGYPVLRRVTTSRHGHVGGQRVLQDFRW